MFMKVAVIYNEPEPDRYYTLGESKAELGVLDEVRAVCAALAESGYPVVTVPLHPPLKEAEERLKTLQSIDLIFNLFEGFDGRPETEGELARILEELKIPFTGCSSSALKLSLDKVRTRGLLAASGIPTPGQQILTPPTISSFHLGFPCIVKPLAEDASHGLSEESVVHDFASLENQVQKISHHFGGKALVEEFIDGREFNVIVTGNSRLTVPAISEIVYTLPPDKPRILTFEAKWEENSLYYKNTKATCPAQISLNEREKISGIARKTFKLTGCRGYARVDFRQDSEGNFKVLEVNPNPDISPDSGAARQVTAAGMTYSRFIEKIIRLALKGEKTDDNPRYEC